jgi:peptidyl-prolyl cis-trans isomerase SurA
MMRLFLCLIVLAAAVVPLRPAFAQAGSIVAVVNEDAISKADLEDRMRLIVASSGIPNSPEIQEKLRGQVMSSLIEEQIKLQEARRLELEITQDEINQGFAMIAQQNNLEPEKFRAMITGSGLNIATMERQIEAQIAWTKIVQSQVRPRVNVTDADIDQVLERVRSNKGKAEYQVAEIFLPVDDAKSESDTQQLAQRLAGEIKSGKAPFPKVAQQFSKAASAAQGGNIGWVQQGQLPEEIDRVLGNAEPGMVSDPIRTVTGYHIILMREKRVITDENMPSREAVLQMIGNERLERAQRRYYLDLKSAAFVDDRAGS